VCGVVPLGQICQVEHKSKYVEDLAQQALGGAHIKLKGERPKHPPVFFFLISLFPCNLFIFYFRKQKTKKQNQKMYYFQQVIHNKFAAFRV
jgi:hypothetical protein